jgi:hypothetical protein
MKAILILIVIGLILALIGWISFRKDDNGATMRIETDRIERDTGEAVDRGRELIEDARREIREERDERVREDAGIDDEPLDRDAVEIDTREDRTPAPARL